MIADWQVTRKLKYHARVTFVFNYMLLLREERVLSREIIKLNNFSFSCWAKSGKHDYSTLIVFTTVYFSKTFLTQYPSCFFDCAESTMIANEIGPIRWREIRTLFAMDIPLPPSPLTQDDSQSARSNRRYTLVESKLNVEFSRFTSASFSRVAGRLLFLGPRRLLGFASISNANSRRSREEDAEQSTRGVARENKSRYQSSRRRCRRRRWIS